MKIDLIIRLFIDFSYIAVLIIIGGLLISKYLNYGYKPLFYWGLSLIALSLPHFWEPINNLLTLTDNEIMPASQASLFYIFGPFTLLAWVTAWSKIMYSEKSRSIIMLTIAFVTFLQIQFFIVYFINLDLILRDINGVLIIGPLIQIFGTVQLIIFLLTAFLLFIDSRKSRDLEIRIKGTLFLIVSLSLFLGNVLYLIPNLLTLILSRLILVIAVLLLYISHAWPPWAKRFFLKESKTQI